MRAPHDLGGLDAGAIVRDEHDHAPWEKRVDAIVVLLAGRGLIRVDELRRAIESLGAEAYDKLSYYERWISAVTTLLTEKGVLTVDEIGRKLAEVEARTE
jgi:hypothetical protein